MDSGTRAWSDPGYEAVARLLKAQSGLNFGPSCSVAAEAGTRRVMERLGITEVSDYVDLLEGGKATVADLIDELAVGETCFFRQPSRFELIRQHILPLLMEQRRHGVIYVWSAGCASGEEPYSLAILFEEAGVGNRCEILATDISRVALGRAREASYGFPSVRGMDDRLIRSYFQRCGYREVLEERMRERVRFLHANLADPAPPIPAPGSMDLVLCCNVLIYFDQDTIRSVATKLYESLAPGGWLITGAADPFLAAHAPFEAVVTRKGVLYRRRSSGAEPRPRRAPAAVAPRPTRATT